MRKRIALVFTLSTVAAFACKSTNSSSKLRENEPEGATAQEDTSIYGKEEVPPDEAENIAKVIDSIRSKVTKDAGAAHTHDPANPRPARRDAHPKAHGCVLANFQVQDNLSTELAQGIFAHPGTYPAWIRYSNGSMDDDPRPDGRGMAVKVIDVNPDGALSQDRILSGPEGEQHTQDFLMINHPVFFMKDVAGYVPFSKAQGEGLLAFSGYLATHPAVASLVVATASHPMLNPLGAQYWSMVPYKFGPKAMKYSAKPCGGQASATLTTNVNNFLREAMKKQLDPANGMDTCFDFMVQVQRDPARFPIEDPTVRWPEDFTDQTSGQNGSFQKVATITIPKQTFDSPAQMKFCEDLSYSPWHGNAPLKPLGGINRARGAIYTEISRVRHKFNTDAATDPANRADQIEPNGTEHFD